MTVPPNPMTDGDPCVKAIAALHSRTMFFERRTARELLVELRAVIDEALGGRAVEADLPKYVTKGG